MGKPKIPEWVTTITAAVNSGRKIEAVLDGDGVTVQDVTDVPHENDPRWGDPLFEPYRDMFPGEDLMPFDVMVGLFAALGVEAGSI